MPRTCCHASTCWETCPEPILGSHRMIVGTTPSWKMASLNSHPNRAMNGTCSGPVCPLHGVPSVGTTCRSVSDSEPMSSQNHHKGRNRRMPPCPTAQFNMLGSNKTVGHLAHSMGCRTWMRHFPHSLISHAIHCRQLPAPQKTKDALTCGACPTTHRSPMVWGRSRLGAKPQCKRGDNSTCATKPPSPPCSANATKN